MRLTSDMSKGREKQTFRLAIIQKSECEEGKVFNQPAEWGIVFIREGREGERNFWPFEVFAKLHKFLQEIGQDKHHQLQNAVQRLGADSFILVQYGLDDTCVT